MDIGVSSYSFSGYMRQTSATLADICGIAKDMGFDGIEFIDLPAEGHADELEQADALRARCDELGLPVVAYTVRADFLEDEREADRLKQKLEVAAHLGAKLMRHDVTWRTDVPWRDIIARTAPAIREVTEYAQTLGIATCTENHGFVLQDADRLEALMRAVDHPNYGWLVDFGNFLCADQDPFHALPIAAPYAFHAHAKDFLLKDSAPGEGWITTRGGRAIRGTVLGHGVVPIAACVSALRQAGYDGWLSLEFEGWEDCLRAVKAGLAYLRAVTE
ncbi:MAG: sugar phosphate isomerase/epimerase [Clostridiales bacterium]|nr:sugar phosphate isomerase/epimerase [Clostridiales bacterium]